MQQIRRVIRGTTPLVISIPHIGTYVPPDIKSRMTDVARRLPDTDWHLDKLYWFAIDMGATVIVPTHSRYVVDLNRPPDDDALYPGQVKTGLCPFNTFGGQSIYEDGEEPDGIEQINRVAAYWLPYHEALGMELRRVKDEYGYAMLYDAHSIKSEVPRLFEGKLPDLNVGTARGASCDESMADAVMAAASSGDYSTMLNGRFVGGYITRHYGQPESHIHAVQMEVTQANYMEEKHLYTYEAEKADRLSAHLRGVLAAMLDWGYKTYAK